MTMRLDKEKAIDRTRGMLEGRACIFASLLPDLREKAESLGYALGLHGSMVRDFDLIAVPWVESAVGANELADALQSIVGGWASSSTGEVHKWAEVPAGKKPHGRLAYTLRFGGDRLLSIDLSVMPVAHDAARKEEAQ